LLYNRGNLPPKGRGVGVKTDRLVSNSSTGFSDEMMFVLYI